MPTEKKRERNAPADPDIVEVNDSRFPGITADTHATNPMQAIDLRIEDD
jgi:hypothetical protein